MKIYIQELKKNLAEMEVYEKLADEAEKVMIENPTDLKAEHEFDVYYSKQFNYWTESVRLLSLIIKCDDKVAKKMIAEKREEIKSIISMME